MDVAPPHYITVDEVDPTSFMSHQACCSSPLALLSISPQAITWMSFCSAQLKTPELITIIFPNYGRTLWCRFVVPLVILGSSTKSPTFWSRSSHVFPTRSLSDDPSTLALITGGDVLATPHPRLTSFPFEPKLCQPSNHHRLASVANPRPLDSRATHHVFDLLTAKGKIFYFPLTEFWHVGHAY